MKKYWKLSLFNISIIAVFVLSGCLGGKEAPKEQDLDAAYTQAAQTIVAELTHNAPQPIEESAEAQVVALTPTETFPPTSTPVPTKTPQPTLTFTPTKTPLPSNTPTPIATSTAEATPEPNFSLVFEDNFSYTMGWPTGSDSYGQLHYTQGGYMIKNKVVKDVVWSTRSQQFTDLRVEVTASRVGGSMEGYYGVVCRFANGSNYYLLGVSSDGSYLILKKKTGNFTYLIEGKDESGVINLGDAPNTIMADCIGNSLSLFANGQLIASVEDGEFISGAAGIAVGTKSNPGYEVLFDDFKIYKPE